MKTKIIAVIVVGAIISSISVGYMIYLIDEPKTAIDCRKIFGKGTTEMYDCLEKIKNNILTQKPSAIEPKPEDVLDIAQEFIKSSPTFAFDGIEETLSLELVFIRESFPEQYVIEGEFSTLHGGYGDRTDQMVIQVITLHTMNLVVISEQITSAIIDGKWDELNQIELPWTATKDPNETVSHVNEVVDYVSLLDNLRANDVTVNPEGEIPLKILHSKSISKTGHLLNYLENS